MQFFDSSKRSDPGVVDKKVQASTFPFYNREERRNKTVVGQISRQRVRHAAVVFDSPFRRVELGPDPRRKHNHGAAGCEQFRGCSPDAPSCPCCYTHLAVEILHCAFSPFWLLFHSAISPGRPTSVGAAAGESIAVFCNHLVIAIKQSCGVSAVVPNVGICGMHEVG